MREFFDPQRVKMPVEIGKKALTVTELTRLIKKDLEASFGEVSVRGEVSNLRRPQSGHIYFSLKDETSQLAVVMFRSALSQLRFELKDGLEIYVYGRVTVYEARGNYQVIAAAIEPRGVGALELAFKQLKEKLEKEGLFDPAKKKEIPHLPERVAIVTSPTGAALRDILHMIDTRFPKVWVTIYPVRVQGKGAAEEIASAINDLNALSGFDVMIVGRGGGSLEDLWAFNEEVVARAIFASSIPVISAVGHEMDITISDLVADKRAPTPTGAGEMVVPRLAQIVEEMESVKESLDESITRSVQAAEEALDFVRRVLRMRHPISVLNEMEMRLDDVIGRVHGFVMRIGEVLEERLGGLGGRLEALSPLKVLSRGFSVTLTMPGKNILKSVAQLKIGDTIQTLLRDGEILSTARRIRRNL